MNPEDPQELKNARALWLNHRFDEALAAFDAVLLSHPDHPLALIDAARAFGGLYQIAKAENLIDRFLTASGNTPSALTLAGQTFRMIHRGAKALNAFESSVALSPPDPATGLEHAMLLDRAGKLTEAETALANLLDRHPEFPEARFFHSHVAIRRGDLTAASQALETLASNDSLHPYLRTRACYALAEAADRANHPPDAIRHAIRAKSFGKPDAPQLERIASLITQQGDQLARSFNRSTLTTWQQETHPPVALLTGSPRSGTTLLEKILDAHSSLRSSDEHDLFARFLAPQILQPPGQAGTGDAGKRLTAADPSLVSSLRNTYFQGMEELLGEPLAGRVILDKNPSLTELIPAWLRVLPHSKILIMLRDPRDVVLSCFLNHFPLNAYTVSFLTLKQTARRYAREMESWLRIRDQLPSSQWREVRYEDCVHDLRTTAGHTLDWLGLDWSDDVADYRSTLARRLTNSPTYADVQAPLHTRAIGKWQRYADFLTPVRGILAPYIRHFGYQP